MRERWELSPCIEWLFAEDGRPFPERVARAAEAGFRRVEFWGTRGKDLEAVARALDDAGVAVTAFLSEPAATHPDFLRGVEDSSRLAPRMHALNLIVLAGDALAGVDPAEQRRELTRALRQAAPLAASQGVGVLLEPLNTRVDHPGYFLDSTTEALDIVRQVGHPAVRLLYDLYHSVVMGEEPEAVLAGAGQLVGHVHIADAPGRHQPGTGAIDWLKQLAALREAGYTGALGLEYMPMGPTDESLAFIRELAGR